MKAYLFPPDKPKVRRLTSAELEEEKLLATIFKRPMRQFFGDTPIYPWLPPEPVVNFELNYKK